MLNIICKTTTIWYLYWTQTLQWAHYVHLCSLVDVGQLTQKSTRAPKNQLTKVVTNSPKYFGQLIQVFSQLTQVFWTTHPSLKITKLLSGNCFHVNICKWINHNYFSWGIKQQTMNFKLLFQQRRFSAHTCSSKNGHSHRDVISDVITTKLIVV